MLCRDSQFYLRLRRHAGDELGTDVAADLDRHLAGCSTCAADAHCAASFDRSVAASMRTVPVPTALRDKLFTQASTYHGGVIRRQAYKVAALAASVLLAVGIGFGVFSVSRPRIDTDELVRIADDQLQNPDAALRPGSGVGRRRFAPTHPYRSSAAKLRTRRSQCQRQATPTQRGQRPCTPVGGSRPRGRWMLA